MRFSRYTLQTGLTLLKSQVTAPSGLESPIPITFKNCHIGTIVGGCTTVRTGQDTCFTLEPGSWFIVRREPTVVEIRPGDDLELFTLECSRDTLQSLLSEVGGDAPVPAGNLHYGSGNGRLRKLSLRIQNCPTAGLPDRLTLEALALRWLAEVLQQPEINQVTTCAVTCPTADSAAVMAAARFLKENLHEPHSIARLSRRVHLNEFKLKKGFRDLYDTSIFGYLRAERMERAAELLSRPGKNVAEVANEVGYSNPSHFARAFKDQHGVLPKRYQQARTM